MREEADAADIAQLCGLPLDQQPTAGQVRAAMRRQIDQAKADDEERRARLMARLEAINQKSIASRERFERERQARHEKTMVRSRAGTSSRRDASWPASAPLADSLPCVLVSLLAVQAAIAQQQRLSEVCLAGRRQLESAKKEQAAAQKEVDELTEKEIKVEEETRPSTSEGRAPHRASS